MPRVRPAVSRWGNCGQGAITASRLTIQNNTPISGFTYIGNVEYAKSTSAAEFIAVSGSEGEWSPVPPPRSTGTYIWQKTTKVEDGVTTYMLSWNAEA